ncbi:diguanylate cyclase (GGDEF)-like protein [Rhodoferax ferrireducens]|uniref:Diguanylate cyclase (GGDEF)-like protein n=1 Tax=Rhodoferax ferrireducens TaxID=192843 RepID=A0ABU2C803_9BURK|nr:GGDEF domain-containing protein [Rhodoferax ferrireducens]MDR7377459.1 diguanylate cyclase (GGDEF)-like protein [Rhodoferax ferrireducens]
MDQPKTSPKTPSGDLTSLVGALEQSQSVRERVEACADILGSAKSDVMQNLVKGAADKAVGLALTNMEQVEGEVQDCADDLHDVNDTLAQGVAELARMEAALAASQQALAASEAALLVAQDAEQQAKREAMHDAATGLPNREHFNSRLVHAIAQAQRHGLTLAVMFFDLDKFKAINDGYGHAAGDSVLQQVADRLLAHCRAEDTVCRNGGDEFLYLLIHPQGRENIGRIAQAVRSAIGKPMEVDGQQLAILASIGISIYPDDGALPDELVHHADLAMYVAKKAQSGVAFFAHTPESQSTT